MTRAASPLDVTIIGGGMITNDLILPSVYHLQRDGVAGTLRICALNSGPLRELAENAEIRDAFPGSSFEAYPDLQTDPKEFQPDLYKAVLDKMPPRQAVIVAVPDAFHYAMVLEALQRDQHVLCVKPLVLQYTQAVEIEHLARERGLFVGVEYHKRFDRRSLLARRQYRQGDFGEFTMAEAKMIEPYYYRHSNFQNWFTCDKTDPFVYVGCHYVDLVTFITGLKPVAVSVSGIKGRFPNGNEGYMWANGRVKYENGALLSVIDGLGYPDDGGGTNDQCLVMFCTGQDRAGMLAHDDQFRGVEHAYMDKHGPAGGSRFRYVNPDFYRLVAWEGEGAKPVGYGYDSIAASIQAMHRIETETAGLDATAALNRRREMIAETDARGIIATPANSAYNELVVEAARLSILSDGDWAEIHYGDAPKVALRTAQSTR